MDKKIVTGLLIIIILLIGGYWIVASRRVIATQSANSIDSWQNQKVNASTKVNQTLADTGTKPTSTQNPDVNAQKNNSIPSNWEVYTNDKYGFTFQYPPTWSKNRKDAEVIDLSNNLKEIDINLDDTISKSTLLIAYHLAPNGIKIYEHALSQYDSTKGYKRIIVARDSAIELSTLYNFNGRGRALKPPLKVIIVDLFDKRQRSLVEFQFKTLETNDDKKISKFNKVLSSFKFIN